jgi:lipopolysaccharide transport system ATP-binding protein
MSDIAIRASHLSKCYHIYNNPHDRLKQFVVPYLQRLVGRNPKQYFHEFWAINDISFEIKKGETVGVIGRNGSGKSTLLQLLCGTLTPTHGQVEINGRVAALLELGSGFNPEFTGRENVYLNAAVLGLSREKVAERFEAIAAFADIGEFIEQPVKTYSSGMMVRLAFAVIVHVDADILVIDEALAVGDAFFTQKCMRFLRDFMKTGTVLFVSHDTSAVVNLCNRAILLSRNKKAIEGKTDEICRLYVKNLYAERDAPEDNALELTIAPLPDSVSGQVFAGAEQVENPIRITEFRHDADSFGTGGIKIIDAWFEDDKKSKLLMMNGGDLVTFCIKAKANQSIRHPAFGFMIKDRLGQYVVAEGTDLAYRNCPLVISPNDTTLVRFSFLMPILIQGEYSLNIAVADGIGDDHIQHHWLTDAIVLHSLNSRLVHGICGLQNLNIAIQISPSTQESN